LHGLISGARWHPLELLTEDQTPKLPEEIVIVRFMQLMSEGHYQPNQDIMREQLHNTESVNLLDDMVEYLNTLSRIPCRSNTDAANRISATILEVIQGPCEMNQEHFVLKTELIETLNRILRSKVIRDCNEDEEIDLKKTAIDILQGLLEGQGKKHVVYDRVLSVIHLDVINMICSPEETKIKDMLKEPSEELVVLRIECLVLLQMFCDYKPSLRKEFEFIESVTQVGSDVASVEVLWRGEIQRRFFHVPVICRDLAKASKDALVTDVDRVTQEGKLLDFMLRSIELYREIKHQQVLKEWKIAAVFSRANQNRATWIAFFLALLINGIMVGYMDYDGGKANMKPTVQTIVNNLNMVQVAFATFTLLLFLIVRIPVKYESNLSLGYGRFITLLYTLTDPMTMYYLVYLIFCVLSSYYYICVSFLLLDIVIKNSTARDVLYAVVYPRKQLAMTMILLLFVVYIFSMVYVSI
jgi:hypothetical protein